MIRAEYIVGSYPVISMLGRFKLEACCQFRLAWTRVRPCVNKHTKQNPELALSLHSMGAGVHSAVVAPCKALTAIREDKEGSGEP